MKKLLSAMLFLILLIQGAALCGAEGAGTPESLLAAMSTEQKVAQMMMPAFRYYTDENGDKQPVTEMRDDIRDMLEKYGFAGAIFFLQNAQDTAKAVRLVDAMQAATVAGGHPQLLTAIDQEGGYVTRLGHGTQMPGNMALGAIGDPEVTEAAAKLIGEELSAIGFNYDAAPVVDVNNNPANPIIHVRSFSDDPELAAAQGVAFMKGLTSAGVIATLKHFPGHGDTDTNSHIGLPCVDKSYEALKALELVPFQACIDAGAEAIMTAHIQYPQIEKATYVSIGTGESVSLPATLSHTIMTDILRGDMRFEGVVISDAMNMDAISAHFDPMDAAELAIEAGVDVILMPVDISTPEGMAALEQYIADVADKVDAGEINPARVDASVLRVLTLKANHGLLEDYDGGDVEARARQAAALVGSAEHHAREWDIARRAATLLKNADAVPVSLEADGKALILVPFASQQTSAQYAVDLAREARPLPEGAEIDVLCLADVTVSALQAAIKGASTVVAVSSVYGASELDPDSPDGMASAQMDAIVTMAHANGAKVVLVSSHLPYDAARYPDADAVVVCWNARGMTEDPRTAEGSVAQYGPNLPAALYAILTDGAFEGRTPVAIPAIIDGKFAGETLYERGSGITANR